MAKAIAKKSSTAMTFAEERPDFMTDSNRGSEDVGMEDIILPRIDVIQALSPQIKKSDAKYIEGAEQGQIFNTVTEHIYGEEITIVPVYFKKEYLVWKSRETGGGFRGAYPDQSVAQDFINTQEDASSLEAIDTAQHFVMVIDGDHIEQAVMSMSRSKMKVSRQLNSMIRMAGGDRFSRAYKIKAVEDSSDKGDYWNLKPVQLGYVPEDVYKMAEEMYEAVKAGERSVDYSDVKEESKDEY